MSIGWVVTLLAIHTLADFFLQTDWMAVNKSKNSDALLAHTAIYSAAFLYFGLAFVLVTWASHTVTDAITSRISSYFWRKEQRHWFFCTIGVDQFIHATTLLLTYRWLVG